jgi:hypothetical protein
VVGEKEIGIEGPGCRTGQRLHLYHNNTLKSLCLRCGTSLEQIAAESATRSLFDFVHCDIWHRHYSAIPDRVFARRRRRRIQDKEVNAASDEILWTSQKVHSCG